MIVNPGIRRSLGGAEGLLRRLLNDGHTIADYNMAKGVTGTIYASEVANQIPLANQPHGDAGSLLQATGANQPWHLPFTGQKYLANFAVAGNYASTPNAAANQITGSIDVRVKVAMKDWTPSAANGLIGKTSGAGNRSWRFEVNAASGALSFQWSQDGTTGISELSSATDGGAQLGTGFTDGTTHYVRVTRNSTTGDVNFYTSDDGVTWSQLGVTQTGVTGAMSNQAVAVEVGATFAGTANITSGKIYNAQIYNGINGTLAVDFNAEDSAATSTNGATFVSSTTGETWTLNNTGALKAQIVGSASLLFDGTAHFMKAAAFTCAQPTVVFLDGKQPTWTATRAVFDGNTLATGELIKTTATPQVNITAGSSVAANTDWTLNTRKIVVAAFNGASSSLQVGGAAATTGNAGAGNMAGFTLGANGSNLLFGNTQVSRVIIRNNTANADAIRTLMMAISGTT